MMMMMQSQMIRALLALLDENSVALYYYLSACVVS